MPTGKQIALEHAFHGVLAQHLHNAAILGEFAAIQIFITIARIPARIAAGGSGPGSHDFRQVRGQFLASVGQW